MKIKILALLGVLAAVAIAGCGSNDDTASSGSKPGNSTDRAFVAEMVPHHESAIEMAKVAQERGESAFVKNLAANIIKTQDLEISEMKAEDAKLADAGIEEGDLGMDSHMMGMDIDMHMLETANPFDMEFMKMMITHHKGAVMMAEAELDKGSNARLQLLAKDIISAQNKEIDEMNAQLAKS